jgi:hypothetical protein
MKKLSFVLVGISTNALVEVCKKSRKSLQIFTFLAITFVTFAGIGKAATFTVTNINDSGAGSLRQAVTDANNAAGADIINFDQAVFNRDGRDFLTLQSEISITSDLTVNGPTRLTLWLNGSNTTRLINITSGNVTINHLTFWRGVAGSANTGGGIRMASSGTVNLANVTFTACTAGEGGAIYVASGNLSITNSTFLGNAASGTGGRGGAILINGSNSVVIVTSSTFTGNNAVTAGGGVSFLLGTFNLRNSILANNTSPSFPDISASANVSSLGYNVIKNATNVPISGNTTGNQLGIDPLLSGLTFSGGGSVVPLQRTSPAMDAGDPSLTNTTDQRLARRNTDGNLNGVAGVDIGAVETQKTAFDYNGEETADLAVLRSSGPGSPLFWLNGYDAPGRPGEVFNPDPNAFSGQQFGLESDIPVPGDYDGDGLTDAAVYRPSDGNWYINATTTGFRALHWGISTDTPVPADYDGDGKTDIAVYRAGIWYILKSTMGFTGIISLGTATDKPVPADYDGDLKADAAIFRNGIWTINRSLLGLTSQQFGLSTDVAVPADYDGNGSDNIAVFRPSSGTWFITRPAGGFDAIPFGISTDKLVPADYDGDGKVDIAVTRVNTISGRLDWYVLQSRNGFTLNAFGLSTDKPTPNSFISQ